MSSQRAVVQSMQTATLADLLERILDKGIVIAGDIRVRLVEVELLTVQIRLVVCSVDKAKEMGLDWWVNSPMFGAKVPSELRDTHPREVDTSSIMHPASVGNALEGTCATRARPAIGETP